MKYVPAALLLFISFVPSSAWSKKPASEYPLTYSGGSLPFNHNRIHAILHEDEVVLTQHGRRVAIPAKEITGISCAENAHYIGVSWAEPEGASEALLKLSSAEYHDFLIALEKVAGRKAVDTNQVPTVVRYHS